MACPAVHAVTRGTSGGQGLAPLPPSTILTFAHNLAPPWEAKPSLPGPHQQHILGNGGVLSRKMWVAALGSSWLGRYLIDQVSFQRALTRCQRKLAPTPLSKLDLHHQPPCHPSPPPLHPIAGQKPSSNPREPPQKGGSHLGEWGWEGGKAHVGPCFQALSTCFAPPHKAFPCPMEQPWVEEGGGRGCKHEFWLGSTSHSHHLAMWPCPTLAFPSLSAGPHVPLV